jgi:cellulose synthase/poly-beta-1,6-N-acetylglucosamine synthase-like glycosyltransferase
VLVEALFWATILALVWVYMGYPAFVSLLARVKPLHLETTAPRPNVTVAVAVHNEAAQIRERLLDVLAQDPSGGWIVEVLVGSDGSTDDTERQVDEVSRADSRVRLLPLQRAGQTLTQDALFRAARGDVVVLTDAETRFAPECVARLADVFRDPRVACATGRLEWRGEDTTATSANEGLYWRYERAVRSAESRAGFLTAVTGALLGVRRSSYRAVPPTASMDHLLPLYARADGRLVVYVPDASATDRPISGVREQFVNRSRTATRGIVANLSMVTALRPWRHPSAAAAVWSHKLLRWATPWLVVIAALAGAVLAWNGQPAYGVAPLAVLAGALAGLLAHAISRSGRKPPAPIAFARAFGVVNLAFAMAWVNVVRGRRIETWHRTDWEALP